MSFDGNGVEMEESSSTGFLHARQALPDVGTKKMVAHRAPAIGEGGTELEAYCAINK